MTHLTIVSGRSGRRRIAAAAVCTVLAALSGCEKNTSVGPQPKSLQLVAQTSTVQPSASPTTPMQSGGAASAPRTSIDGRGNKSAQDGIAAGSRGERTPGVGTAGGLRPSNPTTPSKAKSSSPESGQSSSASPAR